MPDPNNPNPPRPVPAKPAKRSIQAPKGTRDLYPDDANLRRFITESWRNASIRHGFEEIDGPTFEDADLYKVKSGDGILAEMFGVFSGKSPEDVEAVRDPERGPPYALRPEFTPTLARMYASRAAQLPKPTKWFTTGPFFRAERPQRGRLREFLQWNVDFIGGSDDAAADADLIACCIDMLERLGLTKVDLRIKISDRRPLGKVLQGWKLEDNTILRAMQILDAQGKAPEETIRNELIAAAVQAEQVDWLLASRHVLRFNDDGSYLVTVFNTGMSDIAREMADANILYYAPLLKELRSRQVIGWCDIDSSIVRGLAYYTGMVFEVIADGQRAVAGGGRYDNLIELFGGPPTPAVGFGMGDVVLTNLLRDKGLLPEGKTLLDKLSQAPASLRADAFVLTADESLDPLVRQLVADLRRGGHGGGMLAAPSKHANSPDASAQPHACSEPQACHPSRPLHARHSYKSTRNVGKLLKEAAAQHARVAVIIENPTTATLKPLDGGDQFQCQLAEVPTKLNGLLRA